METIVLKQRPDFARVIRAADRSYKKHNAFVTITTSVELSGTAWDGGSRSMYTAVDLATYVSKGAPQYDPPQFGGPRQAPKVELPPGVVIIRTGIFLGKTATAHVYVHPENVAKLLPSGN